MYSCRYPVVLRIKSPLVDQTPVGMGVGKRGKPLRKPSRISLRGVEGGSGKEIGAEIPFGNGPGPHCACERVPPAPGAREQRRSITQGDQTLHGVVQNASPPLSVQLPPNLQADRLQNGILITNFKDERVTRYHCLSASSTN